MSDRERPTLTVVVPVFNQASSIVDNVRIISERVTAGLRAGESAEVVVVSDGSIDATEEELVARGDGTFRVFHYDRNLGKGYAVRLGTLEAMGEWIGFVDADLDLDPAALAVFVHRAQERDLDFAIGSKRHPDSKVDYPAVRVAASRLFQLLVRLLFRLDVRDTQVGLKVFRRAIAEQVMPLLLVKRYAFDIELLAVARAFGFARIEEMPITLDYRFAGSGVRSRAVLRALVDTAAIFYRLRVLRYYQRRRAIAGVYGWTRPREHRPLVSVVVSGESRFREIEYSPVEVVTATDSTQAAVRDAAERARGEVLAIVQPGGLAAGNLLSATVPYLARSHVAAVVFPKLAPLAGPSRLRAAAAIDESRVGAGLGYFRHTPGNVRYVRDYPAESLVVRRDAFLAAPTETPLTDLVSSLSASGWSVFYTPDTVVVVEPPPLYRPHLAVVAARGRSAGRALRAGRARPAATTYVVAALLLVAGGAIALELGGEAVDVVLGIASAYGVAIILAALAAAFRHRSLRVGALVAFGIPWTHAAFAIGAIRGISGRR